MVQDVIARGGFFDEALRVPGGAGLEGVNQRPATIVG